MINLTAGVPLNFSRSPPPPKLRRNFKEQGSESGSEFEPKTFGVINRLQCALLDATKGARI